MKKTLLLFVAMLTLAIGVFAPSITVNALETCDGSVDIDGIDCNREEDDVMDASKIIINVVIGVLGVVAVCVIIYGGFQYIVSSGEAGKVAQAKSTILYAVVGLIVVILAFAIVNFVLGAFAPTG